MAEEERFTRVKHASRPHFPQRSIKFVLEYSDNSLSDVDAIAIGRDHNKYLEYDFQSLIPGPSLSQIDKAYQNYKQYYQYNHNNTPIKQVNQEISKLLDDDFTGEYMEIPHHRCHAASASYCADFTDAAVLTIDGKGETDSTVLWNSNLDRIKEFSKNNSLGHFYSTGCKYLGFRGGTRDAGKVMGLASYGNYREDFENAFNEITKINHEKGEYDVTEMDSADYELLEDHFGPRRIHPDDIEPHHKDFAYHLQKRLEDIVKALVRFLITKTGKKKITLAGGVAMNCKLNREILNMDVVDGLFVQPAANDSGICLGAALEGYRQLTDSKPNPELNNLYYGPEYSDDYIKRKLESYKINYTKLSSTQLIEKTAELLASGNVIGWYQGRMEFGARALGHRSILADPTSSESLDKVNSKVKNREKWRPFAPSLLYEAKDKYLVNADEAPYMILLDSIKKSQHDEVPAITHVDGTTRPQTVRKSQNKRYWKLIKKFEEKTGTPVVLNTSFNVSGEPIVESPEQAIADFYTTGLDALIIENFILTKPNSSSDLAPGA